MISATGREHLAPAGGCADDPSFADWRRNHPARKRGRQSCGDLECAAVGIVEILAEHDHFGMRGQHPCSAALSDTRTVCGVEGVTATSASRVSQ